MHKNEFGSTRWGPIATIKDSKRRENKEVSEIRDWRWSKAVVFLVAGGAVDDGPPLAWREFICLYCLNDAKFGQLIVSNIVKIVALDVFF